MTEGGKNSTDLLVRLAGLAAVALVGAGVAGCGLALAFGNYRLSGILFAAVVTLLVVIKAVLRLIR